MVAVAAVVVVVVVVRFSASHLFLCILAEVMIHLHKQCLNIVPSKSWDYNAFVSMSPVSRHFAQWSCWAAANPNLSCRKYASGPSLTASAGRIFQDISTSTLGTFKKTSAKTE